ncbi:MFS transporter [Methanoculleus chikugoensis]|uniref:MFS transporter n=1 Tax=Methanoculleus chikugoensis TaxID=118126 RepID=UPI000A61D72A|nr:MFS transporter [Methanoculleus chikugoensis]
MEMNQHDDRKPASAPCLPEPHRRIAGRYPRPGRTCHIHGYGDLRPPHPGLPGVCPRLGVDESFVGIIFGLYAAMLLLFSIPMGLLSDRVGGRRPLIVAGMLLLALATALFGFSATVTHLIVARAVQGGISAAATWSAGGLALIAETCDPARLGERMGGIALSAVGFGTVIGPVLGGGCSLSTWVTPRPSSSRRCSWLRSVLWSSPSRCAPAGRTIGRRCCPARTGACLPPVRSWSSRWPRPTASWIPISRSTCTPPSRRPRQRSGLSSQSLRSRPSSPSRPQGGSSTATGGEPPPHRRRPSPLGSRNRRCRAGSRPPPSPPPPSSCWGARLSCAIVPVMPILAGIYRDHGSQGAAYGIYNTFYSLGLAAGPFAGAPLSAGCRCRRSSCCRPEPSRSRGLRAGLPPGGPDGDEPALPSLRPRVNRYPPASDRDPSCHVNISTATHPNC